MTEHMHSVIVPGCYRCDLGRDEEAAAEQEAAEQFAREEACPGHNWSEITYSFGAWAECIRCGREEDR